jgi:hypothetical protein
MEMRGKEESRLKIAMWAPSLARKKKEWKVILPFNGHQ